MRVPPVSERKNKILQVAVIRGADDQVASGPKQLLREMCQIERSNQVLDDLGCDRYVKALVANDRRIVIHPQPVKYQSWCSKLCQVKTLSGRFATDDFVSVIGQLAA